MREGLGVQRQAELLILTRGFRSLREWETPGKCRTLGLPTSLPRRTYPVLC